jgi:hypothetical protein
VFEESRPSLGSRVAAARHEREHATRQAKLDHIREQVAAGTLVVREMSDAERTRWASQHAASAARATPAERTRRARELENRRRRAERLVS